MKRKAQRKIDARLTKAKKTPTPDALQEVADAFTDPSIHDLVHEAQVIERYRGRRFYHMEYLFPSGVFVLHAYNCCLKISVPSQLTPDDTWKETDKKWYKDETRGQDTYCTWQTALHQRWLKHVKHLSIHAIDVPRCRDILKHWKSIGGYPIEQHITWIRACRYLRSVAIYMNSPTWSYGISEIDQVLSAIFPLCSTVKLSLQESVGNWLPFLMQVDMSKKKDDHVKLVLDYSSPAVYMYEDEGLVYQEIRMIELLQTYHIPWLSSLCMIEIPCTFYPAKLFLNPFVQWQRTALKELTFTINFVARQYEVGLLHIPLVKLSITFNGGVVLGDLWEVWQKYSQEKGVLFTSLPLSQSCQILTFVHTDIENAIDSSNPSYVSLFTKVLAAFPHLKEFNCKVFGYEPTMDILRHHPTLIKLTPCSEELQEQLLERQREMLTNETMFMNDILPVDVLELKKLVYMYGDWCRPILLE